MSPYFEFVANCSTLFAEYPVLRRPAMAKAAGFRAIEFWWPWPDNPAPSDQAIEEFVQSILEADLNLVGLNFFGGDQAGPDCGVLSHPHRVNEFRDSVAIAVDIGGRLGVHGFNALYGNRLPRLKQERQNEVATDNLLYAARTASTIDAQVWLEPISGKDAYPLRTASDVIRVINRTCLAEPSAERSIRLLADLYHLASNGDDVFRVIRETIGVLGHVQIADAPGRGEPGSGNLPIADYLQSLSDCGYQGAVALEFVPPASTEEALNRMHLRGKSSRPSISN